MTQKNFKYPLAISGTESQLREMIPQLEKIGYRSDDDETDLLYDEEFNILVTDFAKTNGRLGFSKDGYNQHRRIVPISNPKLVLALAAMIDDDKPHVGESIIAVSSYKLKNGNLYTITELKHNNHNSFNVNGYEGHDSGITSLNFTRKATKEEIINHFTNMNQSSPLNQSGQSPVDPSAPTQAIVPVSIDFLREIYNDGNVDLQKALEDELPKVFPPPTFELGDRIRMTCSCIADKSPIELIIAQAAVAEHIILINLLNGKREAEFATPVNDIEQITELELIIAGDNLGLNRYNYERI